MSFMAFDHLRKIVQEHSQDRIDYVQQEFDMFRQLGEQVTPGVLDWISERRGFTEEQKIQLRDKFIQCSLYQENNNEKEGLPLTSITVGDFRFETGKSVCFPFIKNMDSASKYFKDKSQYQMDIEPVGTYVSLDEDPSRELPNKWVRGEACLKNPLVLSWKGRYNDSSWKAVLFRVFGKKGSALTKKLMAIGHDGIVTVDGNDVTEIVILSRNLAVFKEQAEYRDFLTEGMPANCWVKKIATKVKGRNYWQNNNNNKIVYTWDLFHQQQQSAHVEIWRKCGTQYALLIKEADPVDRKKQWMVSPEKQKRRLEL